MDEINVEELIAETLRMAALDYGPGVNRTEFQAMDILFEILLRRHIYEDFLLSFANPGLVKAACSNTQRLFGFYCAYQKAKHEIDGYKLHRRPMKAGDKVSGKVVYIADKYGNMVTP